jgi:hypothetical protein
MHLEINERTKRSKNTKQESYKLQKLKFGNEERKKQNEMKKNCATSLINEFYFTDQILQSIKLQ